MLSQYLPLVQTDYDKDKLEYLYTDYYPLMFSVAMKYLQNEEAAKDAVHDSFLKIIRYLDHIDRDNPTKTKTLLCTVVKNRAIDLLRRTTSIPVGDTEDVEAMSGDNTPAPIEYLLSREGYEHLLGYIDELGDTYRSVCRLKYVNGLREAEIADLLNLSPKTVSVRLFRARRILKNKIREGHHVPE